MQENIDKQGENLPLHITLLLKYHISKIQAMLYSIKSSKETCEVVQVLEIQYFREQ
jgi:phenylalanine-4-hydroxylase